MRGRVICLLIAVALCAPAAARAEESGSPSGIAPKGKWVMGLAGDGVDGRELSGGANATIYGLGHYRGYGVTDWLTAYVKIGGAYVRIDDPSVITATGTTHSFGGNLLVSGQLKARFWEKRDWGLQWDGSAGYTDIRGRSRRHNQLRLHQWKLATSLAKELGKFTPYMGLSYSWVAALYRIRQPGDVIQQGTYNEKQPVDMFIGTDYALGESDDASVNVEWSFLNGEEVDVGVQYLF